MPQPTLKQVRKVLSRLRFRVEKISDQVSGSNTDLRTEFEGRHLILQPAKTHFLWSMETHSPIVLITGATSGIGLASAKKFAQAGYRLVLLARRIERLQALKTDLQEEYSVEAQILVADVRNRTQLETALNSLPESWSCPDVLVNNAGLALGLGTIDQGNPDDWDVMIDTNIKGLLYVTSIISKRMVLREKGHIINIASIAGKEVYPNGNVYCATKFAVDALSRGMRIDLLHAGIKVTNIAPGMVETEFSLVRFKGDAQRAEQTYKGLKPLSAEDVAEAIWFAASQPPHVNINDILLTPLAQGSTRDAIRKT